MTDVLLRPDTALLMRTLPGAADRARFEVITATITVASALSLNALD